MKTFSKYGLIFAVLVAIPGILSVLSSPVNCNGNFGICGNFGSIIPNLPWSLLLGGSSIYHYGFILNSAFFYLLGIFIENRSDSGHTTTTNTITVLITIILTLFAFLGSITVFYLR